MIIVQFTYSVPEYMTTSEHSSDVRQTLGFDTVDQAQQFTDDILVNGFDGCWPVDSSSINISPL